MSGDTHLRRKSRTSGFTRPRNSAGTLGTVRLTQFWQLMEMQFGSVYAYSVAKDYVIAELGGRTVEQALADGERPKTIWVAVCATFDVPAALR